MKDPLLFRQVPRPETGCLAYVVGDPATREAVLVDPPEDTARIEAAARELGVQVTGVVESHTHADHLSGARAYAARTGVPIWLPAMSKARFPHRGIEDGKEVSVGDLRMRALHTPGHTPDSMVLVVEGKAIVGDTLLVGTVGRADFYPRGPEELYHSIFDRLLRLDDALEIYPAHYGPKHGLPEKLMTTLGAEKRTNEALTQATKADFVKYMTEGWPPKPHGWEAIVAQNNGM